MGLSCTSAFYYRPNLGENLMVGTSTSNIMVQGCNLGNTDHYILVPGPLYFQVARLILLDILLPQTRIVAWLVHFTSPKRSSLKI